MKERRWDILHKFEEKQRELRLKKMTVAESFRILKELHQFAQGIYTHEDYRKINMDKIQILSKVHFMFQKVDI